VADFLDGSVLQEIQLKMNAADWQSLHDKYLDKKTNYKCDFLWRGIEVKNVGIHTRGTGSLNPIKPGLGIEFAQYDPTQTFLGLPSVILRNFSQDPSAMHETLSMRMFERMGLPFQRTAHVRLIVNGTYAGLFELAEPIDSRYLMTRFGEDTGFLYEAKGGQSFHFQYLGDSPSAYVPTLFDPKTHTGNPEGQVIADMVRTINLATDAEFVPAVGKYLDIGAYVAHVAVEIFMGEADGILSDSGMTNFYLYRRTADSHFFFLPWDKEMTFVTPKWPVFQGTNDDVLLRRALQVPEFRTRYLDTLHLAAEAAGGPEGWLITELKREYALIRESLFSDPSRVCAVNNQFAACTEDMVRAAVDYTSGFALERAEFVNDSIAAAGWRQDSRTPGLHPGAAKNAASAMPVFALGEMASIAVELPVNRIEQAHDWPLPRVLSGVTVTVGTIQAPIISVSPSAVWIQIPSELPCGPTSVVVSDLVGQSHSLAIELRPASPGIFAVVHANGMVIDSSSPANGGEVIVAWVTGLGRAIDGDESGRPAPIDRLIAMQNSVSATLGGTPVDVLWAGLAPGFAALQQVVVRLPPVPVGKPVLIFGVLGEPGGGFAVPVQ
jgi:uncharacterized protein (TIGR03437 family)